MNNNSTLKKIKINSFISISSQIITLIIGLIIPKIVLNNYGSDVNGLTNTISQIFVYIALLETGISTAAMNALYKPIKDNDKEGISYWVSLARRYFRKISVIYFTIVLLFSFLMPFLIKTNVNYWVIFFYMFFEGLTSVVSFYFLNTWICFLNANGENYVINIISLVSKLLMYAVKIVLSLQGLNIALIQVGYFLVSLLQLFIYAVYMNKHYPWINYNASPSDAKLPDKNSYLLTEIAWTVFSSTDMIVLSMFVSTELASVYSVYNMIFIAINRLMSSLFVSLSYNLGIKYKENKEQYIKYHDAFNSIFIGGITALMCVTYFLTTPFIRIYTAGINDINYIYASLPFLFCIIQILSNSRKVANNLFGIAGYAKSNAITSVIESGMNILLSVILVNFYGIVGVLIATVITLIPKVLYLNIKADIKILGRTIWKTSKIIIYNLLIFFGTVILNSIVNFSISSYFDLCLWGFVLCVIYLPLVFVINCITNKNLFLYMKNIVWKK